MIYPGARYRVLSALLTVRNLHESRGFFTIPAGEVVETVGDLEGADMIPITFHGEMLLVFDRDLRERSQRIYNDGTAAAPWIPESDQ